MAMFQAPCSRTGIKPRPKSLGTCFYQTTAVTNAPAISSGIARCPTLVLCSCVARPIGALAERRPTCGFVETGSHGAPHGSQRCGVYAQMPQLLRHHPTTVRATTKWSQHLREQLASAELILRSCAVSAASRRRLARQTLECLFDQILPAPPGQKLRTIRSCLASCAPILIAALS